MKKNLWIMAIVLIATTALSGCGGGGGGAPSPPPATPTRAVLKLSTTGTGTQIGGLDVIVQLPAGVTVKSTNAPETDAGVVVASGQAASNSLVTSTYTPASGGAPAFVRVGLVNGNTNGFDIGEFVTINCDLANGTAPSAADFVITSETVWGITGAVENGVSVTVGVELQSAIVSQTLLTLSTSGAGSQIGGIDVTVQLPAGVTVKSTNAPETDAGVVVASGVAAANSVVTGTYSPAVGATPGTVRVVLVNGNQDGFGDGEFVTITCELAAGVSPTASDFSIMSSIVGDLTGNAVAGVSVTTAVMPSQ